MADRPGHAALNPRSQYADDANLRARQRLWSHQEQPFDLVGWVIDLAGAAPGRDVLDVGCGNGAYLERMGALGIRAVGCDVSLGMLRAASPHAELVNADVTELPFADERFDVVLAPHMLYRVPDRPAAARELRRVLRADGVCVAVTNGRSHLRALRALVEGAVRRTTPGWEMHTPATHAFSLENGAAQLRAAFTEVSVIRPDDVAPVRVRDPGVVADVRRSVEEIIAAAGAFTVCGDVGAFVCR